jgi:hypothetical protein
MTNESFRVLVWSLLALVGCNGPSDVRTSEPKGESVQSLVLPNGVLSNNTTLLQRSSFENSSKVAPPSTRPSANCPNGRIALLQGQPEHGEPGPITFAWRPLFDASGNIDTVSSPTEVAIPVMPVGVGVGTDNQMVRLKDGSLLAMKGGNSTNATNPPLLFANQTINGIKGNRGNLVFFRSTDCGASWQYLSSIDYGTFANGKYGFPRPQDVNGKNDVPCSEQGSDANGLKWWVGGGDRPELYACPFTGNVYVTERVLSGPYCPGGAGAPTTRIDENLLIVSTDQALTWQLAKSGLPAASPQVMTSTPDGRLFLLSNEGAVVPTLRFSQPMTAGGIPSMSLGADVSFKENGVAVPVSNADGLRGKLMVLSDTNLGLAMNAWGGAREGGEVRLSDSCSTHNPDCTWAYRSGLLLSDSDQSLAITAGSGADRTKLTLTKSCSAAKPECTWTYKNGEFFSDKSPTRAINAFNGATNGASLVINQTCTATNKNCTFTLPRVEISSGGIPDLRVSASGGAVNAAQLVLTDACDAGNPDCTFTFSKGMIKSDRDGSLAFNAAGGVANLAPIKLSNICSPTEPSCKWTWAKGELISDGSGATPLPINAFGGAAPGANLKLNSACSVANNDCLFSVDKQLVDLGRREQIALSLSRISTDKSSSKVRLVYSTRNADNMLEARLVNFDVANPTAPTSVAAIRAAQPGNHSVMFPNFIDPDYVDMPGGERTNASVLYWEEAPTVLVPGHTYSAKYVTIDGDTNVSAAAFLSVSAGNPRTWNIQEQLGDYVSGGFFWRDKTLNYVAQWTEPNAGRNVVKANVVGLRSTNHGFMIKSDRDANLAFNAAGGAVNGAEIKLSSICSITNASCTWSYRNGLIVSDADPTLALNAAGGAAEGIKVKLSNLCNSGNPDCTWTYQRGLFLSDRNPALAMNAWGGAVNAASIVLTQLCDSNNPDCTFTLPNLELSSAQNASLDVTGGAGATNGTALKLGPCSANNTDCTFTFSKGMLRSDTNNTLAFNAAGGATDLAVVKLSDICTGSNASCLWTWKKGQLINDGSATPLAINAFGGAVNGAGLRINSACTASNNDCVFASYFAR